MVLAALKRRERGRVRRGDKRVRGEVKALRLCGRITVQETMITV